VSVSHDGGAAVSVVVLTRSLRPAVQGYRVAISTPWPYHCHPPLCGPQCSSSASRSAARVATTHWCRRQSTWARRPPCCSPPSLYSSLYGTVRCHGFGPGLPGVAHQHRFVSGACPRSLPPSLPPSLPLSASLPRCLAHRDCHTVYCADDASAGCASVSLLVSQ
jgi:hypothetical protein